MNERQRERDRTNERNCEPSVDRIVALGFPSILWICAGFVVANIQSGGVASLLFRSRVGQKLVLRLLTDLDAHIHERHCGAHVASRSYPLFGFDLTMFI